MFNFLTVLPSPPKVLLNFWVLTSLLIAVWIAVPVIFVFLGIFSWQGEIFSHLWATVLGEYIRNSLALMLGVGAGVFVLGVGTAWLVTMCRFPGCRWLEWALLLPLSAPAYLLAYGYSNLLDFYGPVQTLLRSIFGWQSAPEYWFPQIRSLWGAIAILALVSYPYVYLLARIAFLEQGVCTLEASRSLGCNPWQSFSRVALPLARPAIAAGLALVMMETLNDFGTVQYFGVNTFTTGIYSTWFGFGERQGATQLAAFLMIFVFLLVVLERWSRRQAKFYQSSSPHQNLPRYQLRGLRAIGALAFCLFPFLLGFLIPASYLLYLTVSYAQEVRNNNFFQLASHSLILSFLTAAIALVIGLILVYGQRLSRQPLTSFAVKVASMGYAIPGSVIAVGVLIPAGNFDNWLADWWENMWGVKIGLLLSGTIAILVYAYLVRFLAVALGSLEGSLGKIKPTLDDAARSLGKSPSQILWQVHTPLMTGGLLTAVMLVFVDVMKELPATLVIRPFNFDTLAIRVYQYASDERLIEAAAPALTIILAGMLPVIFLSVQIARSRPSEG
ncbi:iron utilization protein [Synechocystis sp. PCC 6803]|uniref:Iron utilization protein n=1 Tax=Synechocystis sp. (strain ATCC 27184 / PCC 6803 / Kazusa) TaxID=1111708 RepID=Q55534_SYNY3|nr:MULTISPECIES: ABC transporter permease subunit [unclassified Synechocystis]MBD2618992.1 iron ABC transporter permease [Synechocystis sp. FACHB-898]MBD2640195.1 iron ABC transporter permease [Synechocystis sp. FACHB-908]MBD2661665.1 iron ABC transporter permease [Synechocystis sp. FACHB-929]AGF52325.1 iron utilization protein [Synechocystis sp. PCC 6803]ALJ68265.1 iron ABC transporter permease [Synechocystis sp. PCC 6803]